MTHKLNRSDVDSNEELYFSWYLDELQAAGIIISYKRDVKPIVLTEGATQEITKVMKRVPNKVLQKKFMPRRVYTYDFAIIWNIERYSDFRKYFNAQFHITGAGVKYLVSRIEIKPIYDQNNMTRLFKQNQSWVFDKHGIIVDLIKVPTIFKDTFTPDRYRLTDKSLKPRALKYQPKTLMDYIKG